jgi:lipopolysaccharide/colanic/teichoic acid biosynthesis glycosyltransferase
VTVMPFHHHGQPAAAAPVVKSAFDRIVALLLLLLCSVCLALVALAIWLEDDGPLLTRDKRVGRGGGEFALLRFRTSRWDSDPTAVSRTVDDSSPALDATSRVGRLLRLYHLDELLLLVNVVKGDLSLVGPRPRRGSVPRSVLQLGVRPGLVRPWPACAAPQSAAEEFAAVREYLDHWSPTADLRVLGRVLRDGVRRSER